MLWLGSQSVTALVSGRGKVSVFKVFAYGDVAEWGANWGVRAVLLKEAEDQQQQQQQQLMDSSPYSNFVAVAEQTLVPPPIPGHRHPPISNLPSSWEFVLCPLPPCSSSNFWLVLLPDHRAAIRSGLMSCLIRYKQRCILPAQSQTHMAPRPSTPCFGLGVGGGVFDVRNVTSYSVVEAR